ncbi:MAG: addiction module protein [Puniceicoccaceae bacterium]
MSATFEEISRHSVQLPRSKRLALARFLLELDDPAEDKDASDLWHAEILNRVQAVEEERTEGVAYEQVLSKVDAILKRYK